MKTHEKLFIITGIGLFIWWPGIPLARFYGPYLLAWVMNGGHL